MQQHQPQRVRPRIRCGIGLLGLLLAGCGAPGASDTTATDQPTASLVNPAPVVVPALSPPADLAPLSSHQSPATSHQSPTPWHAFLHTPSYAGALVVSFTSASGVTWDGAQWTSTTGADVTALRTRWQDFSTVNPRPALPLEPDVWARVQARAARERVALHDWPRVWVLPVADPDAAEALLLALWALPDLVAWAHPVPVMVPTDTGGTGGPVGDLSDEQTYLLGTNGGLNIKQPSAQYGLTGAGQTVIDAEGNWNYTHSDLPIDIKTTPIGTQPYAASDANCQSCVDHGTAVVGILAAKNNGIGINGIAPNTAIRTVPIETVFEEIQGVVLPFSIASATLNGVSALLADYAMGKEIGGQVLVIEQGSAGPKTATYVKSGEWTQISECPGCVPIESYLLEYVAIQDLTAMGVVVVEGAANGAISLDDPAQKAPDAWCGGTPCPNLASDDSGALMVGASAGTLGPSLKASWSNCGNRVNVFAWGWGVVTTGYGDHPMSVKDDPNQWYTNTFAGTSAATAIIGGMVALVQEYVDQLYADQLEDWQHAYLNAAQVRALFTHPDASTPQSDGGCHIGRQPDLGKALQLLKDGVIQPKIAAKGGFCENTVSPTCESVCATNPLDPEANCGLICDAVPHHPLCAQWCAAKATADPAFNLAKECPNTYRPLAKFQDVDGDGRADLIAWSRDHTWYVDLSATPAPDGSAPAEGGSASGGDGFGAWDLTLTPPSVSWQEPGPNRLFPVVQDYDSDGRADLALYNTDTGVWQIKYTSAAVLAGDFGEWDTLLDYSATPGWQPGSRPMVGDFDGDWHVLGPDADGAYRVGRTIDLSYLRPDGQWAVDYRSGAVEDPAALYWVVDMLPPTITLWLPPDYEQTVPFNLKGPAWAYLPVVAPRPDWFQIPTGVPYGDRLLRVGWGWNDTPYSYELSADLPTEGPAQYLFGDFNVNAQISRKSADGAWIFVDPYVGTPYADPINQPPPTVGFGDLRCHPIVADFDGDGWDDRAVLCPHGEWRVAYSGDTFVSDTNSFRIVGLGMPFQALPGMIAPGGIDYQTIVDVYSHYDFGCLPEQSCTIDDLSPPIGPYFAECLAFWANHPLSCLQH